jgi:transposase
VLAVISGGFSASQVAQKFGVSRQTLQTFIRCVRATNYRLATDEFPSPDQS